MNQKDQPVPGADTSADTSADTTTKAERIASEGDDVRARTRDLVVDSIRHGAEAAGRLPDAAAKVLDGAWKGLRNVADEKRASVFSEVLDGLTDGLSKGAHALKLTVQEARGHGRTYAEDEVKGAVHDLRTLETMLVERVEKLVSTSAKTTANETKTLLSHAQRAASSMRPEIESAIKAAEEHPIGLVKETASVVTGATRRATGTLLQGIAGVLDGLGESVRGGKARSSSEASSSASDASREA